MEPIYNLIAEFVVIMTSKPNSIIRSHYTTQKRTVTIVAQKKCHLKDIFRTHYE